MKFNKSLPFHLLSLLFLNILYFKLYFIYLNCVQLTRQGWIIILQWSILKTQLPTNKTSLYLKEKIIIKIANYYNITVLLFVFPTYRVTQKHVFNSLQIPSTKPNNFDFVGNQTPDIRSVHLVWYPPGPEGYLQFHSVEFSTDVGTRYREIGTNCLTVLRDKNK